MRLPHFKEFHVGKVSANGIINFSIRSWRCPISLFSIIQYDIDSEKLCENNIVLFIPTYQLNKKIITNYDIISETSTSYQVFHKESMFLKSVRSPPRPARAKSRFFLSKDRKFRHNEYLVDVIENIDNLTIEDYYKMNPNCSFEVYYQDYIKRNNLFK